MAINEFKKIGNRKTEDNKGESFTDTMKPFIKFGIGAIGVIATSLIYIVKSIPKPEQKVLKNSDGRIIKLK